MTPLLPEPAGAEPAGPEPAGAGADRAGAGARAEPAGAGAKPEPEPSRPTPEPEPALAGWLADWSAFFTADWFAGASVCFLGRSERRDLQQCF